MSRDAAIANAREAFDSGAFEKVAGAPHRAADREPESGARQGARRLCAKAHSARARAPRLRLQNPHRRWRQGAVPHCGAPRESFARDRARLWPWRHGARHGGALDRQPQSVRAHRARRQMVWARRRRQQGPALDQSRGARGRLAARAASSASTRAISSRWARRQVLRASRGSRASMAISLRPTC